MNIDILKILIKLAEEVLEKKIPEDDLDESLINLGLNSITFIKLTVKIETEFDVEFSDEDLDISKYTTLNALKTYIEERI